jgi:cyclic-di-GMP phosphodiesterase, flagellum assembly factor TipF
LGDAFCKSQRFATGFGFETVAWRIEVCAAMHYRGGCPQPPGLGRGTLVTVLIHAVYAAAYCLLGLAVGITLPYISFGIGAFEGALAGALIVLGGGLVHETVSRTESEFRIRRRLRRLEERLEDLTEERRRDRDEVNQLAARVDEAKGLDLDAVVGEMKLLQSLVGRLHERRGARTGEGVRAPRRIPESGAPILVPAATGGMVPHTEASVLEAVRDALRADRIDIYLQPIVSLPQRKHRFYEVYSRVRAADGVQIMPDRYIELAEREGLIATIDNLLLIRCVQLIRETERRQHAIGFFSNISSATLSDGEFMRQFLHFMEQNRSLVPKLVFEMSQADWSAADAATRAAIGPLARMGFRFSMDQVTDLDVDAEALARADIRYLKVDRAPLVGGGREKALALRDRLSAHAIDLIVEKIETEAQLTDILDLGLDFGEGYLFGEPRLSRKPT